MSITSDTNALLEMNKSLSTKFGDQSMTKALTTASGLVYYDLQKPSKLLVPWLTPLRNKLPRVGRPQGYGTMTHWKSILGVTGSGFDAMAWVPEGQRSGVLSYSATDVSAAYTTLGEESALTFEAESAAIGFEDANAQNTFILLEKTMLKEETALLGGNKSIALGVPATPTSSVAGSSGTLPTATYSIIVVALTQEGITNSSVAGGVATTKTVTGADANTYTINGGSSNKSAAKSQAVTLGQILTVACTTIRGAVGYAWFVGLSGAETLQSITSTNTTTFSAPLSSSYQAATAITADCSKNDGTGGSNPVTAFDGIMTAAFNAGSNAYYKDLGASTLTSSGAGTVVEIDTMLQTMWDTYRVSPTVIWVNSQQLKDIRNKVLNGSSSPLLRMNQDASGRAYELQAGGTITFYFNPFTTNGGDSIPVMLHPTLAPGTILAYAEHLPTYYKNNETPQVAEVITRRDYYRIDWPLITRQRQYGVYSEEVLAVYAPFALGIITNVAAG